MSLTYEQLKEKGKVLVFVMGEDYISNKYIGRIGEEIQEDIPLINANKGDFWIIIDKLKQRFLGKENYCFIWKDHPVFYFVKTSKEECLTKENG